MTWSSSGSSPQPIDNTNYNALLQIRTNSDADNILYEASTAKNNIVCQGSNGVIFINISATDTEAMTWSTGIYDLLLQAPDGTITRLVEGTVTVRPGVSKFS